MRTIILFFSLVALNFTTHSQTLLINEFMAKNSSSIEDKDGDYSDWIEIYNPTDSEINLNNYSITDNEKKLRKWIFPAVTIQPNGYLILFASDKDEFSNGELHTNFKISTDGEKLILLDNEENIIDSIEAISLSSDESYGRVPDGSFNWSKLQISSPNTSNNPPNIANEIFLSAESGFYENSFYLTQNSILEDTIYYTLNGDIPTPESNIFGDSIFIQPQNNVPNQLSNIPTSAKQSELSSPAWQKPSVSVDKITTLRFASFKNGKRTSDVYSKTFLVGSQSGYTLPVISLVTENQNLFDEEKGIFVPGENFDPNIPEWTGNYFMKGDEWERDVHITYFTKEGKIGFSQNAGIRNHGGKTRQAAQKSLRLYARKEYGEKNFDYKLLPNRDHEEYKRFTLRSTMGGWGKDNLIKDALSQSIVKGLNIDHQDFQPVIVFINGEYWGIHTLQDRLDERYVEYIHQEDKDSVQFRDWYFTDESLVAFIEGNDLSSNNNYEEVISRIDVDNFIDYSIAEMFFANYDWPSNNAKLWRKIEDGKWRWIFFDLDAGFRDKNYNMFAHNTKNDPSIEWPNSPGSTLLFRNLLKNDTFKSKFIARYAQLLNTTFQSDYMLTKLDSIANIYRPEIEKHIGRWSYPESLAEWESDIEIELEYFLRRRPCAVRENIINFFDLDSFDFECETKNHQSLLYPNPNQGEFIYQNNDLKLNDASITIYNTSGQLVFEETGVSLNANEKKSINLKNLVIGIYYFKIKSTSVSEIHKVFISNY